MGVVKDAGLAGLAFVVLVGAGLRSRWADSLTDALDNGIRRRLSGFGRRYRAYVVDRYKYLDVKDLSTRGAVALRLQEIFIDLSLVPQPADRVKGTIVTPESAGGGMVRRDIWSFLDRDEPSRLAVLGSPGAGKTTLLKHVATSLARHRRGPLPILLFLRDNAAAILADPSPDLATLVEESVRELRPPDGWLRRQLQSGRCLVMLDGLDEVPDPADRRRLVAWVERQAALYGRNDFLVTSRPHGYRTTPLESATVVSVRPLTEEQIGRFLRRWYLLTHQHSRNERGPAVTAAAEEDAADLLRRLLDNSTLLDLAANPLLLTMIAHVHFYRGALPGNRAELYEEICGVFLGRRAEVKGLPSQLTVRQKMLVLQHLAFRMMVRKVRDLSGPTVKVEITEPLRHVSGEITPEEFLRDMEESSGLLGQRENGVYAFAHLTFQEYLTARHLQETDDLTPMLNKLGDPWWRETTLLYAATVTATPIVERCLAASAHASAVAVVADCLDQAREVDPALRERFEQYLRDGSETALARIQIARTVRQLHRLGADRYAYPRPITNREYRAYGVVEPAYGGGDDPAAGIPLSGAVLFVEWLSAWLGDGWLYRLPRRDEQYWPGAWWHDPVEGVSGLCWSGDGPIVATDLPTELPDLPAGVLRDDLTDLAAAADPTLQVALTAVRRVLVTELLAEMDAPGSPLAAETALGRYQVVRETVREPVSRARAVCARVRSWGPVDLGMLREAQPPAPPKRTRFGGYSAAELYPLHRLVMAGLADPRGAGRAGRLAALLLAGLLNDGHPAVAEWYAEAARMLATLEAWDRGLAAPTGQIVVVRDAGS